MSLTAPREIRLRWKDVEKDKLFKGRKWLADTSQTLAEQMRRWKLAQSQELPEDRQRSDAQLKVMLWGEGGKETIKGWFAASLARNPSYARCRQLPHTEAEPENKSEKEEDTTMMASRYQPPAEAKDARRVPVAERKRHGSDMDDQLAQRDRATAIKKLIKRVSNYQYRNNRYVRENGKPSPMLVAELERAEAKLKLLRTAPLAKGNDETLVKAALVAQRLPENPKRIRWTDDDMKRIAYDDEVRLTVQQYDMPYSLTRLAVAIGEAQIRQLRPELHKDEETIFSLVRRRNAIATFRKFLKEAKRPKAIRSTPPERIKVIEDSMKAVSRHQEMIEPYAQQVNAMRVKAHFWERQWQGRLGPDEAPPEVLMHARIKDENEDAEGEHVVGRKITILNLGRAAEVPPPPTTSAQLSFSAKLARTVAEAAGHQVAVAPPPPAPAPLAHAQGSFPAVSVGQHIGQLIDQSITATVEGMANAMQKNMAAQLEAMQTQMVNAMAQRMNEQVDAAMAAKMAELRGTIAGIVGSNTLKLDDIKTMLIEVVGGPTTEPPKSPEPATIDVSPTKAPKVAVFGLHGSNQTLVRNEIGELLDLRFYDLDHLNDMPRDGTPAVLATKFIPHSLRFKLQGMGCPLVYAQGGAGSVIAALRTMAQERTQLNGAMQ